MNFPELKSDSKSGNIGKEMVSQLIGVYLKSAQANKLVEQVKQEYKDMIELASLMFEKGDVEGAERVHFAGRCMLAGMALVLDEVVKKVESN